MINQENVDQMNEHLNDLVGHSETIKEKIKLQMESNISTSDKLLAYIQDNPQSPIVELLFQASSDLRLSNVGLELSKEGVNIYDKIMDAVNVQGTENVKLNVKTSKA